MYLLKHHILSSSGTRPWSSSSNDKVGDTAVTAAQDRGHDALALQIARYHQFDEIITIELCE